MDESAIPNLKQFWRDKYRANSIKSWDLFYKRNTTNFFKDRHWLDAEFPELLSAPDSRGLEVGCGVGNLVFPALERNDTLKLYACDASKQAVALVTQHADYAGLAAADRIEAFVADIADDGDEDPLSTVPDGSLDFCTCIFVLSAIPPERHARVFSNLTRKLKTGGVLCFRDYASGDLAQKRFMTHHAEVPKLQDGLYVRQDGTLSFFFDEADFRALVASIDGLAVDTIAVVERRTRNVKRNLDEARYFLQAVIKRV